MPPAKPASEVGHERDTLLPLVMRAPSTAGGHMPTPLLGHGGIRLWAGAFLHICCSLQRMSEQDGGPWRTRCSWLHPHPPQWAQPRGASGPRASKGPSAQTWPRSKPTQTPGGPGTRAAPPYTGLPGAPRSWRCAHLHCPLGDEKVSGQNTQGCQDPKAPAHSF